MFLLKSNVKYFQIQYQKGIQDSKTGKQDQLFKKKLPKTF